MERVGTERIPSDLLPVIPRDAEIAEGSKVQPHHRGKVPGYQRDDGKWIGLGG